MSPTARRPIVPSLSRRSLIGSAATGTAAALSHAARLRAQTPGSGFTREASITSWGFGAEETNAMAFSRIEAFRLTYPNVQVELVPSFDDDQLLAASESGDLPDLIWMGRDRIATWASRGVLMPLDELFTGSEIDTSLFYPSAWEQVQVDGQVYGLPQFIDVRALYVNLNALAEIGQDPTLLNTGDWDQLAQLGAQLVARDGDTIQRWGFDHKIQADWLWLWAIGNGGSMMSDDGQEITFDDPKVVDALQWGVDAYAAQGGFASYEATAAAWQADEQFPRGQVAMTMYENWLLGIIARIAPNLNFRVTPITHRGGAEPVSYTGGNAWTIPNGAADPEAAWTFIEFMARPETWMLGATAVRDARVAEGAPFIPSLTANSAVDQQQIEELYVSLGGPFDEAVQLFPSLLAASISLPLGKSTAATQIAEALRDEGILPALRGELSAEEALRQADQSAEASAAAE